MSRWLYGPAVGCLMLTCALDAQESAPKKGKIAKVDLEQSVLTITAEGKDQPFRVVEATRFIDASGAPLKDGLRNPGLKPGVDIMFKSAQRDGKPVVTGVKLGNKIGDYISQAPPKADMTGVKPLMDMGKTDEYKGFKGGLYPDGTNQRPAAHEALGLRFAKDIQPRDREGKPSPDGKIVLLGVGMSNTTQAFSGFLRVAKADKEINPSVVLVDGAFGGMTAARIQHLDGGRSYNDGKFRKYWEIVDERLAKAGVTRAQVQAVWLKEADSGPKEGFPTYAKTLQAEHVKIMQLMNERFVNLKSVYLSSRTYGGWAKNRLNPEPYAFESGLAVKWLIEDQIKGAPELNCDLKRGKVRSPWLSWGPYLWANGATKRADGVTWEQSDARADDGTHVSEQGQDKIGRMLVSFFKTDATTRDWFFRKAGVPQLPGAGKKQ